jgi:hypothetical protein
MAYSGLRKAAKRGLFGLRRISSSLRRLPDFIIIGGQKCGTSSFYKNLVKHPEVQPCFQKETHYFDVKYQNGIQWYRSFFSLSINSGKITGEASPYYIFHPYVPERVYQDLPDIKLIALLRNPVDRAYSHYSRRFQRGTETLSFQEAIAKEEERVKEDLDKMEIDPFYYGYSHRKFSYLSRGKYVEQLERWLQYFPLEKLHIIQSEEFFSDPSEIFHSVEKFLGIKEWEPELFGRHNIGRYDELDEETRVQLNDYFKPYNERLNKLLGTSFHWI